MASRPQIVSELNTIAGTFEGVQLGPGAVEDGALSPIIPELRSETIERNIERSFHARQVPANQFLLPSAAEQERAVRTKDCQTRLSFMIAQQSGGATLAVHQSHRAIVICHGDP